MTAWYNEIDPFAAAWLEALIEAGHIAPGVVDRRDIRDVKPNDLQSYDQCHFFAGIGVWSYALRRAGVPDTAKIWTGSCPCQPFSEAGQRGGFDDERHLWPVFDHLIGLCRPDTILGEQVASKGGLAWLDLVHADLEGKGYAVGAVDLCAAGVGAPINRSRLWWVARSESARRRGWCSMEGGTGRELGGSGPFVWPFAWPDNRGSQSSLVIGDVLSPSYGSPARVGRLRGYGNAINAQAAKAFIEAVMAS